MGTLISESWPDQLEPALFKYFDSEATEFTKKDSQLSQLYSITTKTPAKSYAKVSSASGVGSFTEFNGIVNYSDRFEGYDKTLQFTEYTNGLKIKRDLWDDQEYETLKDMSGEFGRSAAVFREQEGADTFNEAFTTTPTDGDAVSLCNSAHPSATGSSAGTQSNTGTTALSATSVETTRRLMLKFKGLNGETLVINPDLIICEVTLEETAYEIINSKGKVETGDNNVNFHFGKYKLMVWTNFLTDTNNWFFVDQKLAKRKLIWVDRVPLEFFQDKDSDTLVAKYVAYLRFGRTWANWQWIYGHNVS